MNFYRKNKRNSFLSRVFLTYDSAHSKFIMWQLQSNNKWSGYSSFMTICFNQSEI